VPLPSTEDVTASLDGAPDGGAAARLTAATPRPRTIGVRPDRAGGHNAGHLPFPSDCSMCVDPTAEQ
jgi:hypothetical protein